jgi:hypothetical protein
LDVRKRWLWLAGAVGLVVALIVIIGVGIAGIRNAGSVSSSSPSAGSIPSVTYPNSIAATVDCGDDGVANVNVQYGIAAPTRVLVGRNPTTLAVGGTTSYSGHFATMPNIGDGTLIVTTAPTRGICTTTLTDYDAGKVLVEQSSAGKVSLTVIVRAV